VKRIREFPGYSGVQVIIPSGLEVPEDVKAAAALGVLAYVVKPLTQEKLRLASCECAR
jgi:AmiR/NasT family two-component response regulator